MASRRHGFRLTPVPSVPVLVSALSLAACGDDGSSSTQGSASATETVSDSNDVHPTACHPDPLACDTFPDTSTGSETAASSDGSTAGDTDTDTDTDAGTDAGSGSTSLEGSGSGSESGTSGTTTA